MCRFAVGRSSSNSSQSAAPPEACAFPNLPLLANNALNAKTWMQAAEQFPQYGHAALLQPQSGFTPGMPNFQPAMGLSLDEGFDMDPTEADLLDLLDDEDLDIEEPAYKQQRLNPFTPTPQLSSASGETDEVADVGSKVISSSKSMDRNTNGVSSGLFDGSALALQLQSQLIQSGLPAEMLEMLHPGRKGAKTQGELDVAMERIKKKRRESAQRSRARKSAYIKALELENKILTNEVLKLRSAIANFAAKAEDHSADPSSNGCGVWQTMAAAVGSAQMFNGGF